MALSSSIGHDRMAPTAVTEAPENKKRRKHQDMSTAEHAGNRAVTHCASHRAANPLRLPFAKCKSSLLRRHEHRGLIRAGLELNS